jgi:hypothetical protein
MPEGEAVPELVPLSVREVVADPVVLLLPLADPCIALFNFTCPAESRQWVAAETPEVAPGLAGGGEVVWAAAANTPAVRKRAAMRSFDMTLLLRSVVLIFEPAACNRHAAPCSFGVTANPFMRSDSQR